MLRGAEKLVPAEYWCSYGTIQNALKKLILDNFICCLWKDIPFMKCKITQYKEHGLDVSLHFSFLTKTKGSLRIYWLYYFDESLSDTYWKDKYKTQNVIVIYC